MSKKFYTSYGIDDPVYRVYRMDIDMEVEFYDEDEAVEYAVMMAEKENLSIQYFQIEMGQRYGICEI